jgi:hypothetical protein
MIAQLESSTCQSVILETSALIQAAQVIRITQAERSRGQSKKAIGLKGSKKRFEKTLFCSRYFFHLASFC